MTDQNPQNIASDLYNKALQESSKNFDNPQEGLNIIKDYQARADNIVLGHPELKG